MPVVHLLQIPYLTLKHFFPEINVRWEQPCCIHLSTTLGAIRTLFFYLILKTRFLKSSKQSSNPQPIFLICQAGTAKTYFISILSLSHSSGTRTRICAVKGRCPYQLDDGALKAIIGNQPGYHPKSELLVFTFKSYAQFLLFATIKCQAHIVTTVLSSLKEKVNILPAMPQ